MLNHDTHTHNKFNPLLDESTIPTVTFFAQEEDDNSMKFERPTRVRAIFDGEEPEPLQIPVDQTHSSLETEHIGKESAEESERQPGKLNEQIKIELRCTSETKNKLHLCLRTKFKSLLPPHLSAKLSESHLRVIAAATTIDQLLLKSHRLNQQKEVTLKSVLERVSEAQPHFDIAILQQILYLVPGFYTYRVEGTQTMICVQDIDNLDPHSRKVSLRKSIYQFLLHQQQDFLQKNQISSPSEEGEWAEGFDVDISIPLSPILHKEEEYPTTSDKMETDTYISRERFSLTSRATSRLQEFKNKLLRGVSKRQDYLQRESSASSHSNTFRNKDKSLRILKSIRQISSKKQISHIFEVNLINQLQKSLEEDPSVIKSHLDSLVSSGSSLTPQNIHGFRIIKVGPLTSFP